MNPFDQPPSGAPVSSTPPTGHAGHDGPRRGRMALAALAAAGLVGGGIVVAGQFASADDRPSLGAAAAVDDTVDDSRTDDSRTDDSRTDDSRTEDATTEEPGAPEPDDGSAGLPDIDGEIVIDDGDGDPIVIDLGELGECVGPILRGGPFFERDGEGRDGAPPLPFDEEFHRRMEDFLGELPLDELGELGLEDDGVRIFGSGGSTVTVVGPDGVEVIDLGEGDATVTIEQTDGELTVETDGDATVSELPDLGELLPNLGELDLGELDAGEPHGLPDLGDLQSCLDDLDD